MPGKPEQLNNFYETLTDKRVTKPNQELEQNYYKFFEDSLHCGIITLDTDSKIIACNQGAKTLYGHSEAGLVGQSYSSLFPESDNKVGKPLLSLAEAREEGHSHCEGWQLTAAGDKRWIHTTIRPLLDQNETVIGYGLIAFDMTNRHLADLKMRQAYHQLEETVKEVMELNSRMREQHLRMTGREYMIRDLENENKMLKLRLEIDCDYRQPEV